MVQNTQNLRDAIANAAMYRTVDGVRHPTSPHEQILCRARFALKRRARCEQPPHVTAYRLDPVLADAMRGLGLVEVLEKFPGEKAPADERSPSGRSKPVHVHILCELTDLGRSIARSF